MFINLSIHGKKLRILLFLCTFLLFPNNSFPIILYIAAKKVNGNFSVLKSYTTIILLKPFLFYFYITFLHIMDVFWLSCIYLQDIFSFCKHKYYYCHFYIHRSIWRTLHPLHHALGLKMVFLWDVSSNYYITGKNLLFSNNQAATFKGVQHKIPQ